MKTATHADVAEALADNLSKCADAIHHRVLKALAAYKGKPVPEAEQQALHALLDEELVLRQRANGMYADAAVSVAAALGAHKVHLASVTQVALDKIRTIDHIGGAVGLVAALSAFAGAAVSGQPGPALSALEKLDTHVRSMMA